MNTYHLWAIDRTGHWHWIDDGKMPDQYIRMAQSRIRDYPDAEASLVITFQPARTFTNGVSLPIVPNTNDPYVWTSAA